jgi:hypothetical protein
VMCQTRFGAIRWAMGEQVLLCIDPRDVVVVPDLQLCDRGRTQ